MPVGGEDLRVLLDFADGKHPGFTGTEGLFQRVRAFELADVPVIPEVVHVILLLGIEAECAVGSVTGKRDSDGFFASRQGVVEERDLMPVGRDGKVIDSRPAGVSESIHGPGAARFGRVWKGTFEVVKDFGLEVPEGIGQQQPFSCMPLPSFSDVS